MSYKRKLNMKCKPKAVLKQTLL